MYIQNNVVSLIMLKKKKCPRHARKLHIHLSCNEEGRMSLYIFVHVHTLYTVKTLFLGK